MVEVTGLLFALAVILFTVGTTIPALFTVGMVGTVVVSFVGLVVNHRENA